MCFCLSAMKDFHLFEERQNTVIIQDNLWKQVLISYSVNAICFEDWNIFYLQTRQNAD